MKVLEPVHEKRKTKRFNSICGVIRICLKGAPFEKINTNSRSTTYIGFINQESNYIRGYSFAQRSDLPSLFQGCPSTPASEIKEGGTLRCVDVCRCDARRAVARLQWRKERNITYRFPMHIFPLSSKTTPPQLVIGWT